MMTGLSENTSGVKSGQKTKIVVKPLWISKSHAAWGWLRPDFDRRVRQFHAAHGALVASYIRLQGKTMGKHQLPPK